MPHNSNTPESSSYDAPRQGVVVLGSTGTVGQQTIDVILANAAQYHVHSLCADKSWQRLFAQCQVCLPTFAVIRQKKYYPALKKAVEDAKLSTIVLSGDEGISEVIRDQRCQIVMSAIVGAAGLVPTKIAIEASRKVLIANKEPIVMVGQQLINLAKTHKAILLPVDSEHNAIQQCLPSSFQVSNADKLPCHGVKRLLLTGSGGPFRERSLESLEGITVAQACHHPNWVMGPKISIDSATMMNKSLELIEACYLFSMPEASIDIVIHPQSTIHSMVEYVDGSIIAQMASSDMKVPIANAMSWPKRIQSTAQSLDIFALKGLDFYPPDVERFPVLTMARQVAREKGFRPVLFNAANEQAVSLFMQEKISFNTITQIIERAMNDIEVPSSSELNIASAIEFDECVREHVIATYQ